MACGHIDRLNIGPIPTFKLSWDQPHEGNLFEHLYRQRAFQIEGAHRGKRRHRSDAVASARHPVLRTPPNLTVA